MKTEKKTGWGITVMEKPKKEYFKMLGRWLFKAMEIADEILEGDTDDIEYFISEHGDKGIYRFMSSLGREVFVVIEDYPDTVVFKLLGDITKTFRFKKEDLIKERRMWGLE